MAVSTHLGYKPKYIYLMHLLHSKNRPIFAYMTLTTFELELLDFNHSHYLHLRHLQAQ